MKNRKIYVTEKDKYRLKKLFTTTIGFRSRDLKTVRDLLGELERAIVIDGLNPGDKIVRMNSTVRIEDLDSGEEHTYTIVYPEAADSNENKISILAPIGTALLGYKEGDTIVWEVPKGKRKLKIKEVFTENVKEQKLAG